MVTKIISKEKQKIINYILIGAFGGFLYACVEYLVSLNTDNTEYFIPLIIRSSLTGSLIMGSISIFEILFKNRFTQRPFLYQVLVRTFFYTFIITLWLFITNTVWFVFSDNGSIISNLAMYINDDMYLINFGVTFIGSLLAVGLGQINSLHRKGELLNFVMGKYHKPREVKRIFCFIDLKGSTTIAEKLGHYQFALFLKDYYSDITEALRKTNAQIYQYIGDEIVLSWSFENGLKNNNLINCFFEMKKIINTLKPNYIAKYGMFPDFKAGLHGGKVIVTWVGELKKEIVYIGDVLNTTSRIQESCKPLKKDFLISEDLLKKINHLGNIEASFIEETILRGKESHIKIYSLEAEKM